MDYLLLIIGFFMLVKGADKFVDGAKGIANILKVPSVIIGLTIVAIGTSMPEASVSIVSAIGGNNDIALSNVVGSNIFNSLVVVGLCAFLMSFKADLSIIKRDLPVNIIISVLLLLFGLDLNITRVEGLVLLILMVAYMVVMIKNAKTNEELEDTSSNLTVGKSVIYIILGLAIIILGGNLVVNSASNIATNLGLSQNLIGLTIVAVGTSLPELVTSLVAVKKGEAGLALGNAIGSNIFNILFILGASSTISPLIIKSESIIDIIVMVIAAIMMYIFGRSDKTFKRSEGFVCVIFYIVYMIYLII